MIFSTFPLELSKFAMRVLDFRLVHRTLATIVISQPQQHLQRRKSYSCPITACSRDDSMAFSRARRQGPAVGGSSLFDLIRDHAATVNHALYLMTALQRAAMPHTATDPEGQAAPATEADVEDNPEPQPSPAASTATTVCARWIEPFVLADEIHPFLNPLPNWDLAELNDPPVTVRNPTRENRVGGLRLRTPEQAQPAQSPPSPFPLVAYHLGLSPRLQRRIGKVLRIIWQCVTIPTILGVLIVLIWLRLCWAIIHRACWGTWPRSLPSQYGERGGCTGP